MGRDVTRMDDNRNAYGVLVENLEGKRSLGRPGRGWEDNIKMDLRGIESGAMDWIHLTQNRDRWRTLMNTV
jgi:hypothetical protein